MTFSDFEMIFTEVHVMIVKRMKIIFGDMRI